MGARSGNESDSFGLPKREFEDEASPKLGSKPPSITGFSTTLISSASLDEGGEQGETQTMGRNQSLCIAPERCFSAQRPETTWLNRGRARGLNQDRALKSVRHQPAETL